jgi:OOP family OmpA-OmpF porin
MKRLLLLPALLLGSATFADDMQHKYEISPMIGYNLSEGNIGMKSDGYYMGGLEIQANSADSRWSPELSAYYTRDADYDNSIGETDILRVAFNGVYTFDAMDAVVPFAKIGAGYETVTSETANNQDGFFADAGAGVKIPFSDSFAFKAEAIYLAKISNSHNQNADNNLLALVGLTYSFGAMEPKQAPVEEAVVAEVVVAAPVIVAVVAEKDSDGDGIYDALDKCPNTPAGSTVGIDGCPITMDDDQDGVTNDKDLCPNTPIGQKVDSNGCPISVNLHINFANDSAEVPSDANPLLEKYADFLKRNTTYSAKIIGYTDNRGSAAYNKKLSQRRAKAVMNALIQRGVSPDQLSAIGMGELNPVASNETAEGRAQNRRIEAELSFKAN